MQTKNRINQLFQEKQNNILSVFLTAGYPQWDDTLPIIRALEEQGVDMIEIGIPFSDPMADGVVIQNSSTVALQNGMSLKLLFAQLATVRSAVQIPLVLMGYLNPIMQYGFERFCQDASAVGIDGVIIPDLPFHDYMEHYKPISDRYNLRVVMLITPETSEERIRLIDQHTNGFIYMVSSASTTGAQRTFDQRKQDYFARTQQLGLQSPLMVGFGISNASTYQAACSHAAGAIIGSKFINLLTESKTIPEAVTSLLQAIGR